MMISANDVLQIINEIHQYSMLLVELRDEVTLGFFRLGEDKLSYFRVEGKLVRENRAELLRVLSAGLIPQSLHVLTLDQFLQSIEGKKAKHIWLESGELTRKELGFLSIAELKSHFRTHVPH
jgi:hypothetical protein